MRAGVAAIGPTCLGRIPPARLTSARRYGRSVRVPVSRGRVFRLLSTLLSLALAAAVVYATVNLPQLLRRVDGAELRERVSVWTEDLGDATSELVDEMQQTEGTDD